MDLDGLAAAHHGHWNDTERAIMGFILAHQDEVPRLSVKAVAARTFTSPSSVMRVAKKLGFSGFAELKYQLRIQDERDAHPQQPVDRLALQQRDIADTLTQLQRVDFEPIAQAILDAGTVYCMGTGFAQRNAMKEFSKSLLTNGIRTSVVPDLTEMRVSVPMMRPDDMLVLASLSGNTPEYAQIPDMLSLRGIPTLAVTRLDNNLMASRSRWNLPYCATPIEAEWHTGSFYSFVGLTVALDYLVRYVMDCR